MKYWNGYFQQWLDDESNDIPNDMPNDESNDCPDDCPDEFLDEDGDFIYFNEQELEWWRDIAKQLDAPKKGK